MPVSGGKWRSKPVNASSPPADAPMPTNGQGAELAAGGVSRDAGTPDAVLGALGSRERFLTPLGFSAETPGRIAFFRAINNPNAAAGAFGSGAKFMMTRWRAGVNHFAASDWSRFVFKFNL